MTPSFKPWAVALLVTIAAALGACSEKDPYIDNSSIEQARNLFLSGNGIWKVDSLTLFNRQGLVVISNEFRANDGTLTFIPGVAPASLRYERDHGIAIHTYTRPGTPDPITIRDSIAWSPQAADTAGNFRLKLGFRPGKPDAEYFYYTIRRESDALVRLRTQSNYVNPQGISSEWASSFKLSK